MKPTVTIYLHDYNRLVDTEKDMHDIIYDKVKAKKEEYEKAHTAICENWTIIQLDGRVIISIDKVILELRDKITELEKRPKRCILF